MFLEPSGRIERLLRYEVLHSVKSSFGGQVLVLVFTLFLCHGWVPSPILYPWAGLHLLNLLLRYRILNRFLALPRE
ncbi:hypothetical protein [Hydrogenimonas sp. SS33]|uniref:hypothetical protein n=1 Tax=Hydrogenimonas leucolamina TaxID=2954236 RepID=UPI00336BE58C